MDRLRQAIDTHYELCDAFDAYLLAETDEDAVGKRSWLAHRFINGGEKAMHELAAVARSVLDAPPFWLCTIYWEVSAFGPRKTCVYSPTQHSKCRWVRLVDDPTTNSVQNSSSLGVDDPQGLMGADLPRREPGTVTLENDPQEGGEE